MSDWTTVSSIIAQWVEHRNLQLVKEMQMESLTIPSTTWWPTIMKVASWNGRNHCFCLMNFIGQLLAAGISEFMIFQHPCTISTNFSTFSAQVFWIVLNRVFAVLWSWNHLVAPTRYFVHWQRKYLAGFLCIITHVTMEKRKSESTALSQHLGCILHIHSAKALQNYLSHSKGALHFPVLSEAA